MTRATAIAVVLVALCPAAAAGHQTGRDPLMLDGPMTQGGLIRGATEPGARVTLGGNSLPVSKEGYFVFGFGRDAKDHAHLEVRFADGHRIVRRLKVRKRKYNEQRITGLPSRQVTPSPKDLRRIKKDSALIRAARAARTDATSYREPFAWPALGIVSGVFGSRRVLNGKKRRPHYGVDVAAKTGTPVTAPAGGVVALAHLDMFYTGRTVMIDHGQGVVSVYAHLSRVLVKRGQKVRKGARIGLIGATGRVTGPHLHWGVTLGSLQLDPGLLVGPMPKPAKKR